MSVTAASRLLESGTALAHFHLPTRNHAIPPALVGQRGYAPPGSPFNLATLPHVYSAGEKGVRPQESGRGASGMGLRRATV
jgi:hypothetical protein